MKVAINKCYGGFSLSHKATMLYGKLKGIKIYPFINARKKDGRLDMQNFVEYHGGEIPFCIYYATKPLKDGKYEDSSYFSLIDVERNDPTLIEVIETLGKMANGSYANICIVEIPDGVDFEISEYDGMEHIAEQHRTWG